MNATGTPWLAHLSTWWTCLDLAHTGPADDRRLALSRLVDRYRPAVTQYLQAAVRDEDFADDLFQEFALRLTRGDFRSASPEKGKFRGYLLTTLNHLICDHRRRVVRSPTVDVYPMPETTSPEPGPEDDRAFMAIWRTELIEMAWAALRRVESETGRPLYKLLQARVAEPAVPSEELATRLSASGRAVSPGWVRKRLMEARARFTDFLVSDVADSLAQPTRETVAEELADLELLSRCQDALNRWAAE